jgi:transcriptional regulator with XRE-family HTH domain
MLPLQKQVGLRLKELRDQKGLSQEELAARCDLHRTYIGLIERGKRSISMPTIELIAKVLDVPPSRLFEGTTSSAAVPSSKSQRKAHMGADQIAAHISTIRQILIKGKLVDGVQYEALLKANKH